MKRKSLSLFTRLDKEEIEALTAFVNETLDVSLSIGFKRPGKNFSQGDMWNINRMKRTFVQRRSIL